MRLSRGLSFSRVWFQAAKRPPVNSRGGQSKKRTRTNSKPWRDDKGFGNTTQYSVLTPTWILHDGKGNRIYTNLAAAKRSTFFMGALSAL